jgi:tRNA/tmRNA/rRNA uracil-C5-methylase (TrmA/RlmC/RlmD family)
VTGRNGTEDAGGGEVVRLEIGAVAHGGHCVARHEGRVVFVRHALPGEQVLARLTQAQPDDRFWRADAVEVLRPSPDRVVPACSLSGSGGCGGCDWQHASLPAQRRLKAAVVTEQLRRLGGVDLAGTVPGGAGGAGGAGGLEVREVPGDVEGLGWRTRIRFAVDSRGRAGLRRHRAHDVVPVPHCPIAHPAVGELQIGGRRWPGVANVEAVVGGAGVGEVVAGGPEVPDGDTGSRVQRLVVVEPGKPGVDGVRDRTRSGSRARPDARSGTRPDARPDARSHARLEMPRLAAEASVARRDAAGLQRVGGRTWVEESVLVDGVRRTFRVTGGGFWQVHPGAAQTLLDTVLAMAQPRPGESALDLYCGVGLFTAGLALRVGESGQVLGVEGDPRAATDARRSLHDLPFVRLEAGGVEPVLRRLAGSGEPDRVDVVVLDPPRAGAGSRVVELVAELRPRVIVYVACDPAALARDVATAARLGYHLDDLAAFDTFPMTHHVECVARLAPADASVVIM